MKEFEPSPDFAARVMTAVRAEVQSHVLSDPWLVVTLSTPLRWSLAFGGAVMTLVNLFRMLASVFAPALCG